MTPPRQPPRAIAFVDGQNVYHGARERFGYLRPDYDVQVLASEVCAIRGSAGLGA